ncbi:MAG: outer membrane beta-barrel protein [Bacteroidales bacterium]|jgi:hypothetical protein|nr:outer membrane beta-barrel protein [Bacteroidales bacterium]
MKKHYALLMSLIISSLLTATYSQDLSVGFRSGINFSDIHGNFPIGKWEFKPGPSQGFFADYSLTPVISLKGAISYSTVYYEYHPYAGGYNIPLANMLSSYSQDYVIWHYPIKEMMNFSYLTIPVQLGLTIPSRPALTVSAGAYYSLMVDHTFQNIYSDTEVKKSDIGFVYSTGIGYPFSDRLEASLSLSYLTGRREFIKDSRYRNGWSDVSFGLSYDLVPGKRKHRGEKSDTLNNNIFLLYRAGTGVSWNSGTVNREKYSPLAAYSVGFDVGIRLSQRMYFRTGLSYDRQGFALRDSSDMFNRYYIEGAADYAVDTRISADYVVIPALLEYQAGEKIKYYFNTGPYLGVKINARTAGKAISFETGEGYYNLEKITVYDDTGSIIFDNDIGWVAGMGLVIPLGGNSMFDIGMKYRHGFSEVYDIKEAEGEHVDSDEGTFIRNSLLTLNFGLRVPVFRK